MTLANPTIKALRGLLRRGLTRAEFDKHLKELSGKNDRLIAVVGSAHIENALRGMIIGALRSGEKTNELFMGQGELARLSSRIKFAYALKLIDNDLRRNLDYIREIRNVFAHRVAPTRFTTPEVAATCRLLNLGDYENSRTRRSMRLRYLGAVIHSLNYLWGDLGSGDGDSPPSQRTQK